jgi:ZIP family zinc transporter
VHAFSDGLNTVSFLIKSGKWGRKGIWLLGVDAIARVSGAALGTTLALSNNVIAIYLAVFAGIVIYLATSHILPEAHSRHSSKLTILATIFGVLVMWGLVSYLHSGDAHAHGSETAIHEDADHHDEESEHHDEETHDDEADHHDEEMPAG